MITTVSIDLIVLPSERVRRATSKRVSELAKSISMIGLLNPITVYYPLKFWPKDAVNPVDGYCLVSGLHRLEACQSLNHTEIAVNVVDLDALHQQLAECDENLCGTNLSKSERAKFTARRKQIYEALYPETRHGGDRKSSGQVGHLKEEDRFTIATAEATSQSERVVRRDARRGERIDEDVLDQIAGTDLDKGIVLDALAQHPKDQQPAALAKIKEGRKKLSDEEELQKEIDGLVRKWEKASPGGREGFMSKVGLSLVSPPRSQG